MRWHESAGGELARWAGRLCVAGWLTIRILGPGTPCPAQTIPPATEPAAEVAKVLPRPDLSAMDPTVRDQLARAREALDRLTSTTDTSRAELGRMAGEIGRLYAAYGLNTAARAAFEQASEDDEDDFRWRYHLGVLLADAGEDDAALVQLMAVHALLPEELPTLLRLGELHLRAHRLDEAGRFFRLALEQHPTSAAAHWGLGRLALEAGEIGLAEEHLEQVLSLQPRAERVHYALARVARQRGDLERAREHLARRGDLDVLFYDPLMVELQRLTVGASAALGRGADAQMAGLWEVAIEEYRRAVSADPENPSSHEALATVLAHTGEVDGAIASYRRALELDPRRPEGHYFLGLLLRQRGEIDQAEEHFGTAAQLDPSFSATRAALGDLLLDKGEPAAAIERFREVLALVPAHVEARLGIGRALAEGGALDEATQTLDTLLEDDLELPQRARAHQYLALIDLRRGRGESALEHLETAVRSDPDLLAARFQLGDQLLRRGRAGDALPHLEHVLGLAPDHGPARLAQVQVLMSTGRHGEAITSLEAGLEARPTDGFLAFNLARLLACGPEDRRDGERALALAHGLWQSGQSPQHAETLAMALAQSGRFADAAGLQAQLVEAAKQQPGRQNQGALLPQLEANLERYRRGETCRMPL